MKKAILVLILMTVLTVFIQAQTPQFYNYGTSGVGNNTLPLGTSVGCMVQWLVQPGELNHPSLSRSGNINNIYFLLVAILGPYDYSRVSILLGQTSLTSLPAGVFFTEHMDTVYHRDSITIHSNVIGTHWHRFELDHPFYYDSSKSLVIQLEHYGHSPGTASYIHAHTNLTGKRRNYCTVPPFYMPNQDAYIVHCGVDVVPLTGVGNINSPKLPTKYRLEQNYPNPFNPETQIVFDIPKTGFVSLKIYDVLGKEIAILVNEIKNPGSYKAVFDGASLVSGTYFYKLESNGFSTTKKMVLIK
jgi:hypothetical protein